LSMRLIALILGALVACLAVASDVAREKKWAEEILPAVLVGEPVWLQGRGGQLAKHL